jgi:NTP pyrophosphatase (non-canonical NTP hydrolase)
LVARSVRDAEVAGSNPAVPTRDPAPPSRILLLPELDSGDVELREFQDLMARTYLERDRRRGIDGTFRRMVEEVGELARTLRHDDAAARREEVSDVLAWLASLANQTGIDLEAAARRYADGCPKCGASPCACPMGR